VSALKTAEEGREDACQASLGLDMPDVVYQTVDGQRVTLTERRWVMHILPRHAEVTDVDVAQALTAAMRIYQHRTEPTRRLYQGPPRATGFFRGLIPTVVVEVTGPDTGTVVTAYLSSIAYRGVQRWP